MSAYQPGTETVITATFEGVVAAVSDNTVVVQTVHGPWEVPLRMGQGAVAIHAGHMPESDCQLDHARDNDTDGYVLPEGSVVVDAEALAAHLGAVHVALAHPGPARFCREDTCTVALAEWE